MFHYDEIKNAIGGGNKTPEDVAYYRTKNISGEPIVPLRLERSLESKLPFRRIFLDFSPNNPNFTSNGQGVYTTKLLHGPIKNVVALKLQRIGISLNTAANVYISSVLVLNTDVSQSRSLTLRTESNNNLISDQSIVLSCHSLVADPLNAGKQYISESFQPELMVANWKQAIEIENFTISLKSNNGNTIPNNYIYLWFTCETLDWQ